MDRCAKLLGKVWPTSVLYLQSTARRFLHDPRHAELKSDLCREAPDFAAVVEHRQQTLAIVAQIADAAVVETIDITMESACLQPDD